MIRVGVADAEARRDAGLKRAPEAATIHSIDRGNFDIRGFGAPGIHREIAWYATADKARLGVVVYDLVDHDYGWVLLTENGPGPGYTAIDLAVSLPTEGAATLALHAAMQAG